PAAADPQPERVVLCPTDTPPRGETSLSKVCLDGRKRATTISMLRRLPLLFLVSSAVLAAQDFRLGVDYSLPINIGSAPITNLAVATDAQGAIYTLVANYIGSEQSSSLVKLTAAGDIVYQTTLSIYAPVIAVDSAGNVYLAGNPGGPGGFVEKLGTNGTTVVYQTPIGGQTPTGIAVDSSG